MLRQRTEVHVSMSTFVLVFFSYEVGTKEHHIYNNNMWARRWEASCVHLHV